MCQIIISFSVIVSGCKKFVDVGAPSSQLISATVFASDNSVKSALSGMYYTFAVSYSTNLQLYLAFATGNSADEYKYNGSDYNAFFTNAIPIDNYTNNIMWTNFYALIYQANSAIAGINNSTSGISNAVKVEALAEAKFLRAFCMFYLVNLWGDVPMPLSTDMTVNNSLTRSPKALVYQQIIADLTEAKASLLADYSFSSSQRTKPNKYTAAAMLARVYLYTQDWANAEANASMVINASTLYGLLSAADMSGIFYKNNKEAILQLDAPPSGISGAGFTSEGQYYNLGSTTAPYYQLTTDLINAFEAGDLRLTNWVGKNTYLGTTYYRPGKYKSITTNTTATGEYCTYLRLAEQYLIRAEARAQQNNFSEAAADINLIRNRAGLVNTAAAANQSSILLAIEKERRVELFGEYGHRFFDLKRTGRADAILAGQKTGWTANAALYPIPKTELLNNTRLTQNPGY